MKKLLAIMTSLAMLLIPMSINVSAEEAAAVSPGGCGDIFDIPVLSPEETEAADRYIDSLQHDDQGIAPFLAGPADPLFEYDYTGDYFYRQLGSAAKELYAGIYETAERMLCSNEDYSAEEAHYYVVYTEKIPYSDMSGDDVHKLLQAFRYSNPQFFFLSGATSSMPAFMGDPAYLYLGFTKQFLSGSSRAAMRDTISTKTEAMLTEINKYTDPLSKELKIVDLLSDSIEYDEYYYYQLSYDEQKEYRNSVCSVGTIDGAIGMGRAVCEGYSMAVTYLCHLADINCIYVSGNNHGWNRVELFGDWYELDVTWIDSKYTTGEEFRDNDWLNKSTATFLANDAARNRNSHTAGTQRHGLSLPQCLKDDPAAPAFMRGDVNGDGRITAVDLVLTKRYVNQMMTEISPAADMNSDGKVTTVDYVLLKRTYAGIV